MSLLLQVMMDKMARDDVHMNRCVDIALSSDLYRCLERTSLSVAVGFIPHTCRCVPSIMQALQSHLGKNVFVIMCVACVQVV